MTVASAYILWTAIDPTRIDILHSISLRLYRTGQLLFAPLGSDLAAIRGSLAQILLPGACALALVILRQRFAAALALMWLAQNLFVISVYISDATLQKIGLEGPVDPSLDWQTLLETWGWLGYDLRIGSMVHFLGFCILVFAALRGFQASLWEQRHY